MELFDSRLTWLNIRTYVLFNFYNHGVLFGLKKKNKTFESMLRFFSLSLSLSLSLSKERDGVLLKETFKKNSRERERQGLTNPSKTPLQNKPNWPNTFTKSKNSTKCQKVSYDFEKC